MEPLKSPSSGRNWKRNWLTLPPGCRLIVVVSATSPALPIATTSTFTTTPRRFRPRPPSLSPVAGSEHHSTLTVPGRMETASVRHVMGTASLG